MATYKIILIDKYENKKDILDLWEHFSYKKAFDSIGIIDKKGIWLKNKFNTGNLKVVIDDNPDLEYDNAEKSVTEYARNKRIISYNEFLEEVKKEENI